MILSEFFNLPSFVAEFQLLHGDFVGREIEGGRDDLV